MNAWWSLSSYTVYSSALLQLFTHVISSIVHIAHEYDDEKEPWPIEIEDHDGQLHSVALQEGEVCMYVFRYCMDELFICLCV